MLSTEFVHQLRLEEAKLIFTIDDLQEKISSYSAKLDAIRVLLEHEETHDDEEQGDSSNKYPISKSITARVKFLVERMPDANSREIIDKVHEIEGNKETSERSIRTAYQRAKGHKY